MGKPIYVIGHKNPDTDSICSAIAYAYFKRVVEGEDCRPARAGKLNNETKYVLKRFGFKPPQLIKDISGRRIILVDHSESGQAALDNINNAEIFEVVDHHRIGDLETSNPILFRVEPVGSTATILGEIFFYHKVKIPSSIAGILLSSILSDTVIFKSPTTTEKDRQIAKRLARVAGIWNIEEFGIQLKREFASIRGRSAKEILFSDYKEYIFGKKTIAIAAFETPDSGEVLQLKQDLLSEMEKVLRNHNLELVGFMVCDILEGATTLLVAGNEALIKEAFGKNCKNNEIYLPGVMSRKKQVAPPLGQALR